MNTTGGRAPGNSQLREAAPEIMARYPEGRQRSALLPLMLLAQEQHGYLTQDSLYEIADILGLTSAEVHSVASFYSMLHLKPKGEHVVSVCHNIACSLLGAERIIEALEDHLDIEAGETTSDGKITLERAECLACCDLAPMIQLDYDRMVGPLGPDRAVALVDALRGERVVAATSGEEAPLLVDSIPLSDEEQGLLQDGGEGGASKREDR